MWPSRCLLPLLLAGLSPVSSAAPSACPEGSGAPCARSLPRLVTPYCPQRLSGLVALLEEANLTAEVRPLAAVYWWDGVAPAAGARLLDRLEALVGDPLLSITPVYPSRPEDAPPPPLPAFVDSRGQPLPSAVPAVALPAEAGGTPATPQRVRPLGLRLEQLRADGTTTATVLWLQRRYGCF